MTVHLWRIGTDTPDDVAEDLKGRGAEITGGRWNRSGRAVVYLSTTAALACLETMVHLGGGALPLNRYLVRVDIPDEIWARKQALLTETINPGWDAIPVGRISLDLGDGWLAQGESALLVVPSVLVPEEFNVLLNPVHADARQISAAKVRAWRYDQRLR
ncbi:MAG: RES family NAD+ phosphorylase [Mitsuaria chitosanitabida]|uniref:RES family NAD+ phosphorylase n=1 Tax=Roseateles chitosanitabidus TaxID=65048 RepID=UPI001AFCE36A|nr:RES family NAD+ phosphorylase [Roseateles chitosanitabidus]MBO9685331.1 RES family NAD+ phosphorylase [Roseateles chitosanitabidus]